LGLTDQSEPGTTIELFEDGTAPFESEDMNPS
jgi:hypothetical protein